MINLKRMIGFSYFPVRKILHGQHIRPHELCRELGIPLIYQVSPNSIPPALVKAIAAGNDLLLFPGYTADQISLLLTFLANFRRCKLMLDIADIPYLQYKFLVGDPSPKSIRDFAKLVHLSDVLIFSTRSMFKVVADNLDITSKISLVVENASNPLHFRFTPLPMQKVILYVGGYVPARGVDQLIEAFKILRRRGIDCRLRIVGFGYPRSLETEGVEIIQDVYYYGISAAFEQSYLLAIPHRPNLYMRIAAPLKLFDAMASGRPIVSTPCDETARILKEEKCGLVTGSEPVSIADGIEYLLKNRSLASEMGRQGRRAIEERFSWKCRAEEIQAFSEHTQT